MIADLKAWLYWTIKRAGLRGKHDCIIEPGGRVKFPDNLKLGVGVKIGSGVLIHCGQKAIKSSHRNVTIGDKAYIGPNCVLLGEGGIEIGKNCEIAPGVVITSQQHTYTRLDIPMKDQPAEMLAVILEDDVWLGCNASVLPGVRIGKGSVIGAGAVVNKDIPAYSVAVGVPAKVIKRRV